MGERTTTRDRNTGGRAGHIRLCDRRLTSRLPAAAPCRRRPLCLGRHPRDKERALVRPEIRERTHAVDLTMNLTIGPAVEVDPVVHSPLLPRSAAFVSLPAPRAREETHNERATRR